MPRLAEEYSRKPRVPVQSEQKEYKRLANIYNQPDKIVQIKTKRRSIQPYGRLSPEKGVELPDIYGKVSQIAVNPVHIGQLLNRKKSYERMMRVEDTHQRSEQVLPRGMRLNNVIGS